MELFLLSLKMSGIKNIEKEIQIDFYKKTIDNSFSSDDYRVKAIYGENGAGKTAIITAVSILKNLIVRGSFLSDNANQKYLLETINKKTHRFSVECEFIFKMENELSIVKYAFAITQNEGKYELSSEELWARKGNRSSKYKCIFKCNNGDVSFLNCNDRVYDELMKYSANILTSRSFIRNYFQIQNKLESYDEDIMKYVYMVLVFGVNINTFLSIEDIHDSYFLRESIKFPEDNEGFVKALSSLIVEYDTITGIGNHSIEKSQIEEYEKKVHRLEKFIKLFKPQLLRIEVERKENAEYYECSLILHYEEYSINSEFESSGIKRLIKLFDYLDLSSKTDIVFIDEMDANINDVYLCKLVEYFMLYGKGQLCFTTHNTSPMSVLRKAKKSIDFLSSDNTIVPWVKNGNFSPDKLYKLGMIENLPFNIDAADFIGIFGGDY